MNDLKIEITDLYPIPIDQPAVRRKGVKGGESKHPTLSRQLVDPECIVPMRSLNRDAVTASVFSRLPAVVDMSMRQHDLDQSATRLRQRFVNGIEISTRVDRGSLTGPTTNDDRTVLGERRYGNDREAKFGTRGYIVNSYCFRHFLWDLVMFREAEYLIEDQALRRGHFHPDGLHCIVGRQPDI
jgi:hypothetical protein